MIRRVIATALSMILLTGLVGFAATPAMASTDDRSSFGSVPPDSTDAAAGSDATSGYENSTIPAPVLLDVRGYGRSGTDCSGNCLPDETDQGFWWRDGSGRAPTQNSQGMTLISLVLCQTGVTPVGPGDSQPWQGMEWSWRDRFYDRVWYGPETSWREDVPAYNDPVTGELVPAQGEYVPVRHSERTYLGSDWSWRCIPPPYYEINNYICPDTISYEAYGPYENPDSSIIPWDGDASTVETSIYRGAERDFPDAGTIPSAWRQSRNDRISVDGNGDPVVGPGAPVGDLRLCTSTWDIPTIRDEWGKYRVTSDASTVAVRIKNYTTEDEQLGRIPDSEVISIGPGPSYNGTESYWQQSCATQPRGYVWDGRSGWRVPDRGFTFTSLDCPVSMLSCPVAENPRITYPDGTVTARGDEFEVLADGQTNTITWDVIAPTGEVRGLETGGRTNFQIMEESQPWRGRGPGETTGGVNTNAPDQFFRTNPRLDRWQKNDDGSNVLLPSLGAQFFRATFTDPATDTPMPWSVQPWWWYSDAEVRVPVLTNGTLSVVGSGMSGTTTMAWTPAGRVECVGAPVDVLSMRTRLTTTE